MAAVKVFLDDSGPEGGGIAVIAGYVADVPRWEALTEEWQRLLDGPGERWDEVKWSRRGNSSDPDVQLRLEAFYRVIERYALSSVCVGVRKDRAVESEQMLPDGAVGKSRRWFRNPFQWAMQFAVTQTAEFLAEIDDVSAVDFIFDEKSEKAQLVSFWEDIVDHQSEKAKVHLNRTPKFEDSRLFMPLQAADMYASAMRQHWVKSGDNWPDTYPFRWLQKKAIPGSALELEPLTGRVIPVVSLPGPEQSS